MIKWPLERVSGPLAPYAAGFQEYLTAEGYKPGTVRDCLSLMAHVSRWLASQDLGAGDLGPGGVEQFLRARRDAGYTNRLSVRGMSPLLDHLRGLGVVPAPASGVPSTPIETLIEAYKAYLLKERGLSAATVRNYVQVARLFLSHREMATGALDLEKLTPGAVSEFVLAECRRSSVGSAKCMVTRLRCLLRFLHVEGHTAVALGSAVASVASWRLASLPKAIDDASVALLLGSCDRRCATGRRDFAVLTILYRLGLRAGEVAALTLADIDWRHGEVVITGKANRSERLPLPTDVGEAIVAWLQHGRPAGRPCPCVFTAVRAPLGSLSAGAVSAIVRNACQRAGLPAMGAHRLRHTAATQMLQAGASLGEVGQILRHRSMNTTSIYAKVDRRALVALVRTWPGGAA